MSSFEIFDNTEKLTLSELNAVDNVIRKVLAMQNAVNVEFSLSFVQDDEIQRLNNEFRGKDEPTDVLSFAENDDELDTAWDILYEAETGSGKYIGDIVISIDTLKRNCEYFEVGYEEEMFRLIIHGILHLLGMDHATNDENEEMLKLQENILHNIQEQGN